MSWYHGEHGLYWRVLIEMRVPDMLVTLDNASGAIAMRRYCHLRVILGVPLVVPFGVLECCRLI